MLTQFKCTVDFEPEVERLGAQTHATWVLEMTVVTITH